ncbi:MAG: phage major tail protein, TP901-1 family [Alphaproteobacteria bacterium]|nr:phage major tail protein, TP901-1 family [Alphaproteobacteria bacterium]
MAAQQGKELLLKIHDGTDYQLIGGFTSNNFTINGETVDVTTKDSAGFKEYLDGAGVRFISTTGEGVFMNDAAFGVAHGYVLAGTHPDCQLIVPGFGTYTGRFAIKSLQMTGTQEGAVTYSFDLESAGVITFA